MTQSDAGLGSSNGRAVEDSLVTYTHVIYALHAASLLVGLAGTATIVGSFLFGIPSVLAVILNYVRRPDVRGTWLESHFAWQIRTFWFALGWAIVGSVFFVTVLLIPLAVVVFAGIAIWVVYRVARGWLKLRDGEPAPA